MQAVEEFVADAANRLENHTKKLFDNLVASDRDSHEILQKACRDKIIDATERLRRKVEHLKLEEQVDSEDSTGKFRRIVTTMTDETILEDPEVIRLIDEVSAERSRELEDHDHRMMDQNRHLIDHMIRHYEHISHVFLEKIECIDRVRLGNMARKLRYSNTVSKIGIRITNQKFASELAAVPVEFHESQVAEHLGFLMTQVDKQFGIIEGLVAKYCAANSENDEECLLFLQKQEFADASEEFIY